MDAYRVGRSVCASVLITLFFAIPLSAQPQPPVPPLPPPPVPPQNPITEEKRILGKLLFWDEQLSSDNTVACGTCHRPAVGGNDPRIARNPGLDLILNTPDDKLASPGVISSDTTNKFSIDPVFGLLPQITNRAANSFMFGFFAQDIFWDGRARSEFTNPESGNVSIPLGGALESQAIAPILSSVEMGHVGRSWPEVIAKLALVTPMILAANLPADIAAVLDSNPSYPDLFAAAFGDPAITAERIAYAIATYERTVVPNQTPWDAFNAGNQNALTPNQVQGLNVLRGSPCTICHVPPQFTNNTFQNIGLRPLAEDNGRQAVTGLAGDRGRFKVPTLRNVGLKPTFMHNGQFSTLGQVIGFYANGAAQFPDNRSPILPVALPPQAVPQVIDFLVNGLTDPRAAAEQFPFDRPMLFSERPNRNPSIVGAGTPGTNGIVPAMIAVSPPNVGNIDFKIGVASALGGAQAYVAYSESAPVNGQLVNPVLNGPMTLGGAGAGAGLGTWQWPIDQLAVSACDVYLQWRVEDPAAADGIALSPIAHLRMIPYLCGGDMNCDGVANGLDVQALTEAMLDPAGYAVHYPDCNAAHGDFNGDNLVNLADVQPFVEEAMQEP
ncbi:MAG TPA: cytochrome c peroxidase [Phycisphaerae bacterium]|nr:cytochrome c peroxidase [Phycisphaerae bacterium]